MCHQVNLVDVTLRCDNDDMFFCWPGLGILTLTLAYGSVISGTDDTINTRSARSSIISWLRSFTFHGMGKKRVFLATQLQFDAQSILLSLTPLS